MVAGERAEARAAEAAEEPEEKRDHGEAEAAAGADGKRAAGLQPGRPGGRLRPAASRSAHAGEQMSRSEPESFRLHFSYRNVCLQKFFGDEYYGEEEEEKPQFEEDDEMEGKAMLKPTCCSACLIVLLYNSGVSFDLRLKFSVLFLPQITGIGTLGLERNKRRTTLKRSTTGRSLCLTVMTKTSL